jgi:hypothetical protein
MIDPQVSDHDLTITPRMLRQFAGLWLAFFAALAAWQYWGRGHQTSGIVFAGRAVAVGPAGMIWPELIRPLFVILMAIVAPIGWLVSTVLLSLAFYLVFTPVAVLFRLIGRDALVRRSRPQTESYWALKPIVEDRRRYFKQF